jgi:hypothetical protein
MFFLLIFIPHCYLCMRPHANDAYYLARYEKDLSTLILSARGLQLSQSPSYHLLFASCLRYRYFIPAPTIFSSCVLCNAPLPSHRCSPRVTPRRSSLCKIDIELARIPRCIVPSPRSLVQDLNAIHFRLQTIVLSLRNRFSLGVPQDADSLSTRVLRQRDVNVEQVFIRRFRGVSVKSTTTLSQRRALLP